MYANVEFWLEHQKLCSVGTFIMKVEPILDTDTFSTLFQHFSNLSSIVYITFSNSGHLLGTSWTYVLHLFYTFFFFSHYIFEIFIHFPLCIKDYILVKQEMPSKY